MSKYEELMKNKKEKEKTIEYIIGSKKINELKNINKLLITSFLTYSNRLC
ncbi:hypothetical protein [Miniphocaeibacter halophilus]|uniref:Uncharacterized protein n=1 Tax=Miniphocaeibacter halophilus TaxID=2931922 RepID=A0AC61MYF2_9FIRM|nr:hypothetical protein [Miniphocaeibacter halophilus]QQK08156.1 hypothetical protein JFY71_01070 [Miniphocaeibacter halophilus]